MASSYISNALQINFESVLEITDNAEMVSMFKALESTDLRGFLGCPSVLYERELEQFFDTAMVKDGDITCEVSGKVVVISEDRFAGVFGLPTEGLVNLSEVPKDLVYDARSIFSQSSKPISTYGKKRLMKYEYRLLNDILAKSVTVKAGSFDAVTHERFLMMTAIHFGIQVNWSKIFFDILKEMVDKTLKKAKGFAAQLCVLLKGDPTVTMGEATTFPPLKILSAKTVKTYVSTNETIESRGKTDDPGVAKIARSKKRQIATGDEPAEAPLQTFDPSTVVSVEKRAVVEEVLGNTVSSQLLILLRRKLYQLLMKLKILLHRFCLRLHRRKKQKQLLGNNPMKQMSEKKQLLRVRQLKKADEMELWFNFSYEEFAAQQADRLVESASETDGEQETVACETEPVVGMELADDISTVEDKTSADEAMTLEEILLTIPDGCSFPSTTGEVTKIQLGKSISIPGVDEGDWYKASLPKIPAADKGKAPLLERDPIKGNPPKKKFSLIIADINLLVQLCEKVIVEVDIFFNSFSFKKLANLKIEDI
ncbi:hypothetical protein F511_28353 [Dorcoceras hygrometricum]|uniref:Dystroglycan-like n=1 Tax=Dorcoceras hygrometricum TaxID=472368 RepID=A0A2Z7BIB3_9LAMI|nr:hypothetical protein F511_28353 [Dorcoceras hygrometricum]